MRHPSPLPADLLVHFTVAEAAARGVAPSRLGRRDLRRPYHGVRSRAELDAPRTVAEACEEYAPRLQPWQFFSHETAMALHGAPTPAWPYRARLHVAAHRPAREPRTEGVMGHRLQRRDSASVLVSGVPVEDPVRAWRQTGRLWGVDDLVAAGDFLVSGARPLASVADLAEEVELMGDVPGGRLRRALAGIRPGPRSAAETHLRLALVRAGLPEPCINWTLRDSRGRFVAELDLAYPRYRVCPEYDGRVHAEDRVQFARDGDRWDRIRAEGWDHVRILTHHMRNGAPVAAQKVRHALQRAGWTSGRS